MPNETAMLQSTLGPCLHPQARSEIGVSFFENIFAFLSDFKDFISSPFWPVLKS